MKNPRKDRILGKIIMRPIGQNIKIVNILDITDNSLWPHFTDFLRINIDYFFSSIPQVPINDFSCMIIRKYEKKRIGIVIEPNFNSFLFKQVSIPSHELDLKIGELYSFHFRVIQQREVFNLIFKENHLPILRSLDLNSPAFQDTNRIKFLILVDFK